MKRSLIEQEDDEDVNITPLLDIVFIMLIFFIVTSTFIKEPGTDISRPVAENLEETRAAILVAINSENQIWIAGEPVSIDAVVLLTRKLRAENPKGTAVIQVDEEAETKLFVDVLDKLALAGIDEIIVSTIED